MTTQQEAGTQKTVITHFSFFTCFLYYFNNSLTKKTKYQ